MQLLELTIDDTSPLIFYSPFRDTLSTPNLTSAWNPYYDSSGYASSPGQIAVGESYHITSKDGAYLSVKWNGNGIRLSGNTTHSSYNVTLDGADFKPNTTSLPIRTLVDISNLQDGDHTITLTAQIPQNPIPRDSSIVFDEAVIRTLALGSSDSTTRQKALDKNSVSFNGRWSFKPMASGQTFHTSTTTGDRACATFNGTAFILQGMTTLGAGNYSVTLDGITTMLSSQSSYTVPNTTLFFATGLNDTVTHSVEVTNTGGNLSLLEDGFQTFVASSGPGFSKPDAWATSSDRQLNGGTVAAFALAGILFAIIISAGLFFIWRKRKRRRNPSTTWDDKRYMMYNPRPGKAGSVGSSWRLGRRTRTSYDIASYGAKGDTMTLESARLEGPKGGDRNGFGAWQREAAEGNVQGISLPILFKHSVSEVAVSPEAEPAETPESKHPYSVYDPAAHRERSAETKKGPPPPTQEDVDLNSAALANLRNKGKARQITGAASTMEDYPVDSGSRLSFSPNDLLQGLHVKVSNGKAPSRIKTSQGSLSLSLNPSTSLVPAQSSRYRNSYLDQLSPFQVASNPSVRSRGGQLSPSTTSPESTEAPSLPSVPRSVSESNSNTLQLQSSPRYLLDDQSETYERDEGQDTSEPLPPPPHAYRNQGNSHFRRFAPTSSLRQVVRSLSPRISEMRAEGANPKRDRFYAEILAEEQSILDEDQLMTVEAPSTPSAGDSLSSVQFATDVLPSVVPLPSPTGPDVPLEMRRDEPQVEAGDVAGLSSTHAGESKDRKKLSPILPSLKRTSPFNIRFDWQSERRVSESSRLRVPHFASARADADAFVQGAGPSARNRFRLTPSTMTSPPNMPSYAPSQLSTEVVTSFLDLTNSSEGSSVRTNSFSIQSSRIFGDPSSTQAQGGRMAALKSRWSDTTSSGRQRDSGNNTTSSSSGDKSSRRRTHHTSTVPPSIYLTSEAPPPPPPPPPPSQIPAEQQRESSDSSARFSSENPVHLHPDFVESHHTRDSLRTTDSSATPFHTRLLLEGRYPPLPEGTDEASTSSLHSPPILPLIHEDT